ncbi:hypothetical protein VFPPC_07053 [Pochonia chlamydosporia 170]|uniref:Uncharacterized protein n=1 Tax=Pochonia chlamydosporia 170 TaxID=1380566 RepID=A0A179FA31_METCM|nr:hypothetical protein VFPPC_07053 [Pochonia chlamydosporia 170]OAQ62312.1 hypothetical protein VFPPC_07053 [Pochonia chlamydosporia 170]
MKQDLRRGRGQWRGCYSFKDIISRDEPSHGTSTRNGGLRMGNTYYYYYEVDGSTEIHDPAQPSTNACPYMPGQTVNTLHVPIEQSLRHRSVSVNSLRRESYMTMNPEARYVTPVPAPAASVNGAGRRLGSASSLLYNRQSNRSESVGPSWKRLFSRKLVCREMERPATSGRSRDGTMTPSSWPLPDSRPTSSSDGKRTRDISPESLRRFLVEDPPLPPEPTLNNPPPPLEIPNEPSEEVDDDDENFATSAISETQVFATRLSPPPFQRSVSADTLPQTVANSSSLTLTIRPTSKKQSPTFQEPSDLADISQLPKLDTSEPNHCDSSPSISSSTFATPMSPQSLAEELPSFYDSNDEDVLSSYDGDYLSCGPRAGLATRESFKGYSLPRHGEEHKSADSSSPRMTGFNTTSLLAGHTSSMPIGGANYLGATIDTGLDDFVNELGLMVDDIGNKNN